MAAMKGAVALVAVVVMALVAACAAGDLYIQFDSNKVEVFSAASNENVVVKSFGNGVVFDYPVTSEASSSSSVEARAQGLYYQASNQASIPSSLEEFTILFLDGSTYTGTSFSFSGVWVSGTVHEFPIVGGTGFLSGLKGNVVLEKVDEDTYKIVVDHYIAASRFRTFLATRA